MSEISQDIGIGMTPEEELELERQRNAAMEAELAPFRAMKERLAMSIRANVMAGNITPEQMVSNKKAFPPYQIGVGLNPAISCGWKTTALSRLFKATPPRRTGCLATPPPWRCTPLWKPRAASQLTPMTRPQTCPGRQAWSTKWTMRGPTGAKPTTASKHTHHRLAGSPRTCQRFGKRGPKA